MQHITNITTTLDIDGFGHFDMPAHNHSLAPEAGTKLCVGVAEITDGARFEAEVWTTGEDGEDTGMIAVWEIDRPGAADQSDLVSDWETFDLYA